jgi:hypothetical protein
MQIAHRRYKRGPQLAPELGTKFGNAADDFHSDLVGVKESPPTLKAGNLRDQCIKIFVAPNWIELLGIDDQQR